MGIRESLLNTITSVADSDFVRIVTSAGASSKATVANLFKSFESGLSSKSSLTTSDYIRVVGSDNNAYKQSVASMKNALNVPTLERDDVILAGGSITANSDLNDYGVGVWSCGSVNIASSLTNKPSEVTSGFKMIVMTSGYGSAITQYLTQIIVISSGNRTAPQIYWRTSLQGTWAAWEKVPTREEIAALNSKTQRRNNNASSYTFTLPNKMSTAFYSFIIFGGVDGNYQFVYSGFIDTSSHGSSVKLQTILPGSRSFDGTFDENTKTLTLTETEGRLVYGGLNIIAP